MPEIRRQAEWFAQQPKRHTLRAYRCSNRITDIPIDRLANVIVALFFPADANMPVGVFDYAFSVFPGATRARDVPIETLLEQARSIPAPPPIAIPDPSCTWPRDGDFISRTWAPVGDRLVVDGVEFIRWQFCEPYKLLGNFPNDMLEIYSPFSEPTVLVETAEFLDSRASELTRHLQFYRDSYTLVSATRRHCSFFTADNFFLEDLTPGRAHRKIDLNRLASALECAI